MADVLQNTLLAFIRLFVAVDAIGVLPIFYALTAGSDPPQRRRIANHAVLTATAVGILFFITGKLLFQVLHITEDDFRVGGGLILLVLAISDLLFTNEGRRKPEDDVGIVPLGIPLIIGPAALTTLLVLVHVYGYGPTLLALTANMLVVALAFRFADGLVNRIHLSGVRAVSKITALFLAAIAVMMIRLGICGMLGANP